MAVTMQPKRPKLRAPRLGVLLLLLLTVAPALAEERLVLFGESGAQWRQASETIVRSGGRILQAFPPGGALVEGQGTVWAALREEEPLWRTYGEEVAADLVASLAREARFAALAWNRRIAAPSPRAVSALSPSDDAAEGPRGEPGPGKAPPGAGFFDTSEFMLGSVAIGVLLPESNGSIDPSTENWTAAEIDSVVAGVQDGLAWWTQHAPGLNLSFVFEFTDPVSCPYEPIARPAFQARQESIWVRAVLDTLGYESGDTWFRARSYLNDLRDSLGTDWAVAVFVADSKNDADGKFSNYYYGFSYYGGPYLVMTYDNGPHGIRNMDAVAAHEFAHSFYALDEYYSAHKPCYLRAGYENVANENSDYGTCLLDEACIMRADLEGAFDSNLACYYTLGQVGLRDDDADSIANVLDTYPATTLDSVPDTTSDTTPTITGSTRDNPLPNRNTIGEGNDITLNTIVRVEYRIDGGSWIEAEAEDGAFDSDAEDFLFTTEALSETVHVVEARAVTSTGNSDTLYATDTFVVIDNIPPAPVLALEAASFDSSNVLAWVNPPDPDLAFVMIRYTTSGFPADTTEGSLLERRPAAPSEADTTAHDGLFPDTTYFYSFFSLDAKPNPSSPETIAATPLFPGPPAALYAPAEGELHVVLAPALAWSSIHLPDPADTLVAYQVQIARDSLFADKVVDQEATTGSPADTVWVSDSLAAGTPYWWRVRGKDLLSGTYGLWSAGCRFATELPVEEIAFLDSSLSKFTNFMDGDSLAANTSAAVEARVLPADTLGIGEFAAWIHWIGAAPDSAPLVWNRDADGAGYWRGEIPFGTAFARGDTVFFFVSASSPAQERVIDDNGGDLYRFVAGRRALPAWHVPRSVEPVITMRSPFIPVDSDSEIVFTLGVSPAGLATGGELLFRVAADTAYGFVALEPDTVVGDTAYLASLLDSTFLYGDLVEYYFRLFGVEEYDTTFLYGTDDLSFTATVEASASGSPFTFLVQSVTGVEADPIPAKPARNALFASRPNPFNPVTAIPFALAEPGRVTITVYDARGRRVRVLVDEDRPAGWHSVSWDGRTNGGEDTPSGLYFAVIRSGSWRDTAKLLLVR
ncbi:MAG: FlgD immunoglobulin-like domain containing protein [Candidatus Eisenbacteria bacterium]